MSTIKIYTTETDDALVGDTADPTIREEQIVRNGEVVETVNRNLVSEAGDLGDTIRGLVRARVKDVLGLTDIEPAYVDVVQVSASGKEYRSKGWMRPDEVL